MSDFQITHYSSSHWAGKASKKQKIVKKKVRSNNNYTIKKPAKLEGAKPPKPALVGIETNPGPSPDYSCIESDMGSDVESEGEVCALSSAVEAAFGEAVTNVLDWDVSRAEGDGGGGDVEDDFDEVLFAQLMMLAEEDAQVGNDSERVGVSPPNDDVQHISTPSQNVCNIQLDPEIGIRSSPVDVEMEILDPPERHTVEATDDPAKWKAKDLRGFDPNSPLLDFPRVLVPDPSYFTNGVLPDPSKCTKCGATFGAKYFKCRHEVNCKPGMKLAVITDPKNTMCKICGSCVASSTFAKHLQLYHSSNSIKGKIETESQHHPHEMDRSSIPSGPGFDDMKIVDVARTITHPAALIEGGWTHHGICCKYCNACFSHSILKGYHAKTCTAGNLPLSSIRKTHQPGGWQKGGNADFLQVLRSSFGFTVH